MPWQNPKTNWKSADVVGPDDLNRIEENIRVHAEDKNNPHNVTSAQVGAVSTAGGTVSGDLTVQGALRTRNAANAIYVGDDAIIEDFDMANAIRVKGQQNPAAGGIFISTNNWKVWHSGNHGPESGLNADLLDGKHLSDIISNIASNTNGSYVRLGDVQVCWKYEPNPSFSTASTFNAFGSTAYSASLYWEYPAPFTDTPAVFATPKASGFSSARVISASKTDVLYDFVNSINQFIGPISMLAIGRWR